MGDIATLAIKVQQQGVNEAKNSLRELANQARATSAATGTLGTNTKGLSSGLGNVAVMMGRVASFGAIAAGVFMGIAKGADRFKVLEGRINLATRSTDEAQAAFVGLGRIADQTGQSMESAVEVFARLSFVRDEIGATTDEMLQFTETVGKLGVLSGASTTNLNAGLTQLGQALSSQYTRAEEFNSIMENIPAVGKAIADQFGVTTGQLRMLVINGQVLSKDVFAAMLNTTEKTRLEFAKYPDTVGRAFQQIGTAFSGLLSGLDKATGSSDLLIGILATGKDVIIGMTALIKSMSYVIHNIGIAFKQVWNDAEVGWQNFHNKFQLGMERITGGAYKAKLDTSAYKIDYSGQYKTDSDFQAIMADLRKQTDTTENKSATRKIEKDYKALAAGLGAASSKTKALKEDTSALKDTVSATEQAYKTLGDGIQSAFESAIVEGKSLKDVMRSLITDIKRALFQAGGGGSIGSSIVGWIQNAIGGGSGASSATGASAGGGFGSLVSSAWTGFKSLLGFADGGSFKVGGVGGTDSQLVQFRASPHEYVNISRGQPSGQGGGMNMTLQIDARGADVGAEQRIRAAAAEIQRGATQLAMKAVQEAYRRDPNYLTR